MPETWSRRVALPALFAISFAATIFLRLGAVAPGSADASPVAERIPPPQAPASPVAAALAVSAGVETEPLIDESAAPVPADLPPPSSHVLPPGAYYWPPD